MIPRSALALLALSGLALAACGSDSPAANDSLPAAGSAPTSTDLDGNAYMSSGVTGYDLVADSSIELAFTTDSLSAHAGCNTMNGGHKITDGNLVVDTMASTMMACPDPLMAQDKWLSTFLSSSPAIALDGDNLTLTGPDATITLAAVQATPLEGTSWAGSGTIANAAVTVSAVSSKATLTIADGRAQINTGCNTGNASVEITDTTTFGPMALTRMACAPDVTELEASVILVLDGEVTYEITGDMLSIRKAGDKGDVGLNFTAG